MNKHVPVHQKIHRRIQNSINKARTNRLVKKSSAYWKTLAGSGKGKPAWVIGNGPSLRMEDLTAISGEISIASNRIYLAYNQTDWRATYVTVADYLAWEKHGQEFLTKYEKIHLPTYLHRLAGDHPKLAYWKAAQLSYQVSDGSVAFSTDPIRGFHGGNSVTYENLQFAAFLGCNPIYLLGCDHYYRGDERAQVGKAKTVQHLNHFHPEYQKLGEQTFPGAVDKMTMAFQIARKWSESSGVRIFNATRGGHLEVFERLDFDELI
jgi:hypothetical protein